MISRRSFLKFSGLAVGAIGAGFGSGRLVGQASSGRRISIHGFVPDDDRAVADLLHLFRAELPSHAPEPVIEADARWHTPVHRALTAPTLSTGPASGSGRIAVRIVRLGSTVKGDVLVSDDRKRIYNPDGDFSVALHALRSRLQSADAEYMISAEYIEVSPLASLFAGGRTLVIETNGGVVDRIPLDGRNRTLDVRGPQGRTGITVGGDGARVHSASCRHQLCRTAGSISRPGDVIACAPNGLLMRVERA